MEAVCCSAWKNKEKKVIKLSTPVPDASGGERPVAVTDQSKVVTYFTIFVHSNGDS
jgi:hypothetical protein